MLVGSGRHIHWAFMHGNTNKSLRHSKTEIGSHHPLHVHTYNVPVQVFSEQLHLSLCLVSLSGYLGAGARQILVLSDEGVELSLCHLVVVVSLVSLVLQTL